MHIFIIARGYPTKQNPQWGCFEKDQALALARLGHIVVILSYRQHPFFPNWGYQVVDESGIHAVSYNFLPGRLFGNHGAKLRVWFERWELNKAYQRAVELYGKPDIIYSHYLFISIIALGLRQYNVPIVAIEHWSETNQPTLRPNILKMGKATYHNVDQLITVSIGTQKSIYNHFGIESKVVYNMVGDEFVYFPHTSSYKTIQFVSTGSLRKIKGYDILLSAFAHTPIPRDGWHLTIIGQGEEYTHLRQFIHQLGLDNNVSLIGIKSKSEIVSIYQQSNVFVLSSKSETFGVAYIEAMACGLPVIATRCGGPEEFVTGKNGILVPIDDVDALAKAIEHMYYHHHEYDRQAIADDCHARFSSKVIAKQLTRIFEEVITKRSH